MPEYINETELAKKLYATKRSVANWRKHGLLVGIKTGTQWIYRTNDIDEFIEKYLGKDISGENYKYLG